MNFKSIISWELCQPKPASLPQGRMTFCEHLHQGKHVFPISTIVSGGKDNLSKTQAHSTTLSHCTLSFDLKKKASPSETRLKWVGGEVPVRLKEHSTQLKIHNSTTESRGKSPANSQVDNEI